MKTGNKLYNLMYNVGSAKYVINYHNGMDFHKDGSKFFGILFFSNKRKFENAEKQLLKDGYVYGN